MSFRSPIKAAVLLAALAATFPAHATIIKLDGGLHATSPYSTDARPWLTATFTDAGTKDGNNIVRLVMTNNLVNATTGLASGEYVSNWLFNIDPTITGLSATYFDGYQFTSQITQTNGNPSIKGGIFDINFLGETANAKRFTGGMTSTYDFSAPGLTPDSFAFKSDMNYYSAADIKGISNGLSGSISATSVELTPPPTTPKAETPRPEDSTATSTPPSTDVPEPTSVALLGAGFAAIGLVRRRKNRS